MAATKASVCCFVLGAILALTSLIGACVLHYFSWFPSDKDLIRELFPQNQTYYWSRYDQSLTASMWVFYTGSGVFLSQALWIIYAISLAFRHSKDVNMFCSPPVMTPILFFLFIIIMCISVGWIFLWMRDDYVKFATVAMVAAAIFSYALLTTSVYRLHKHYKTLLSTGYSCDVWIVRIVVHNTLGALASFLSVMIFYNIAAIIVEDIGMDERTTCYIYLGLTALYTIVFFAVDILSCSITRWTYLLPYCVLLALQGAIIERNKDAEGREDNMVLIVSGILVGMTATMMVFRTMMSVWRNKLTELLEKQANMTLRRTRNEAHRQNSLLRKPDDNVTVDMLRR